MIKNLIFTGGGMKGWAYIGLIRALYESSTYFDVSQVIGVSIGALFGLLYVLKTDYNILLDYAISLNLKEFFDINLDDILINQSLLVGNKFTEFIKEIISFSVNPDITFKELRYYTNVLFTVNAVCLNNSKLEYFNYKLTPDVKVLDAIRASCNLPIFLPPYKINGNYYFDGGICNNCPSDIVDELQTMVFDVSHTENNNCSENKLVDFLNCVVNIINQFHKKETNNIYRILDDKFKEEFFNLNQSKDDIFNIYMNGYKNSKEIIFKNCKSIKC